MVELEFEAKTRSHWETDIRTYCLDNYTWSLVRKTGDDTKYGQYL